MLFKIIKNEYKTIVSVVIIIFAIQQIVEVGFLKYLRIESYKDYSLNEVSDFIKSNTDENAIILSLTDIGEGFRSDLDLSLTRKMERDMFVVYKFVPADLNKIHEWYKRIKIRDDIVKDINNLVAVSETYKIDYVLSKKKFDNEFLILEFNNNTYFLYGIRNNASVKELK